MLESPYNSDDDDMDSVVSESIFLEPTIKHLIKEPRICRRTAQNLVRRRKSI